ncbi:MAG: hypothetical protein RL299_1544 [Pseudomonadota bacterium]|jgi:hypothetical protein
MAVGVPDKESYGVLINWGLQSLGSKLDLKLQCAGSTRHGTRAEIDDHHIVMTREQAAVLANYLYEVSGQTPPRARRGLWGRWFG